MVKYTRGYLSVVVFFAKSQSDFERRNGAAVSKKRKRFAKGEASFDEAPSSSGLGHGRFKPGTRVRIPVGSLKNRYAIFECKHDGFLMEFLSVNTLR